MLDKTLRAIPQWQQHRAELQTWLGKLIQDKEAARQQISEGLKKWHDANDQIGETEARIARADQKLAELDEEEDAMLDRLHAPTDSATWQAAAMQSRKPHTRAFLEGMASLRAAQEQSQAHQDQMAPSGSKRACPTSHSDPEEKKKKLAPSSSAATRSSRPVDPKHGGRPQRPGLVTAASRSSHPTSSSSSGGAYVS